MIEDALDGSYLDNIEFIEHLYNRYKENPASVEEKWRFFFDGFELRACQNEIAATIPPMPPRSSKQIWLKEHITPPLTIIEKKHLWSLLRKGQLFEQFLQTQFPFAKRFSLEGCESALILLDTILVEAQATLCDGVVIGAPHRGRLNFLTNILAKPFSEIFALFLDNIHIADHFAGDVKYHLGHTYTSKTSFIAQMLPNPSHLEATYPVCLGYTKAQQDQGKKIIPVIIHGDGAFSGQGVIYESLQLSQLKGYSCNGVIHIVINNNIAFTTTPQEGRSTISCTDIARAFDIPVLTVNATDPEECCIAAKKAVLFRETFQSDIIIELVGIRSRGHNEQDDPVITYPSYYQSTAKQDLITRYQEQLQKEAHLDSTFFIEIEKNYQDLLVQQLKIAQTTPYSIYASSISEPTTNISTNNLLEIAQELQRAPENFATHPRLASILHKRHQNLPNVDWTTAEQLAFAIFIDAGIHVRLSGQDSIRGTFAQRHTNWVDQKAFEVYSPLSTYSQNKKGSFHAYNSPLSEYAVLGFEYGYAWDNRHTCVLWEAQFGDFCNGAQIIIDQYIAAAKTKWNSNNGLILLLPHGYEGQGPEHSSARIERFLQLAAENNMRVIQPSTPKQYFHALLQQMQNPTSPLIIFTPKSLLHNVKCLSSIDHLENSSFSPILISSTNLEKIHQIILCSGKITYEIEPHISSATALIRVEQLYPFAKEKFMEIIASCSCLKQISWIQEEPENAGAASYISNLLRELLAPHIELRVIARKASSSPATGFYSKHMQEQQSLFEQLFS